jgi:hypothetical protein
MSITETNFEKKPGVEQELNAHGERSAVGLMRLVERLERQFARLKGADSANDFDNSGGEFR